MWKQSRNNPETQSATSTRNDQGNQSDYGNEKRRPNQHRCNHRLPRFHTSFFNLSSETDHSLQRECSFLFTCFLLLSFIFLQLHLLVFLGVYERILL
ncbi:hypothetical protein Daud_0368 [Candidatus Desulforudis audaxviator MP104C]|uniref:Uncharacterized protein n=1 Tax=Desulforudis audaxviator (strain MP104C) TaxID=477974 RepID=B1I1W2_DESAP|nr:hypothetical protein Daud_0368 [Candidatus Desulforudis audaxviator MP104C]